MYPEVEQFIAAVEAAQTTASRAFAENDAARNAAIEAAKAAGWRASRYAYCTLCAYAETPLGRLLNDHVESVENARQDARTAAWDALRASEVPLVRWIAENCRDYAYEATRVLRMLPASMDDLDTMARDLGWCGAWDESRAAAEQAGVLPTQTAASAESEVSA